MQPRQRTERTNLLIAAGTMAIAVFMFAVADYASKSLSAGNFPPLQIVFFRAAAAAPFAIMVGIWMGASRDLVPKRKLGLHFLRGFGWTASATLFVLALAESGSTFLTVSVLGLGLGPVWGLIFSRVFCNRTVGMLACICIVVMLAGVLSRATGSTSELLSRSALLAAAGGVALGGTFTLTDALKSVAAPACVLLSSAMVALTTAGFVIATDQFLLDGDMWEAPAGAADWGRIAANGIASALGSILVIVAIGRSSTMAGPFYYLAVPVGALFDWVWQGDIPGMQDVISGFLVLAGGVTLIAVKDRTLKKLNGSRKQNKS